MGKIVRLQKVNNAEMKLLNLSSIIKACSLSFKPTYDKSHSERSEEPTQK